MSGARPNDVDLAFPPQFGRFGGTVRAIATEFKADKVFIIGSQGILLAWPDAPPVMRTSPEIDVFPENAKVWEVQEKAKYPNETPEASEHIDALFGSGSLFHQTHGFYIDGVDENTATLPAGWQTRAVVRQDRSFIEAYHAVRPLDPSLIEERIDLSDFDPQIAVRAREFIRNLTRK